MSDIDEYAAKLAQKVRDRIQFLPDGTDPTRLEAAAAKLQDAPLSEEEQEEALDRMVRARQDEALCLAAFCVAFYDGVTQPNGPVSPRFHHDDIVRLLCNAIRGA